LYFTAGQIFEIVPDEREPREWRTRTLGYAYTISPDTQLSAEIFTWHFHPHPGLAKTHIHVGGSHRLAGNLSGLHTPTGRVSFENVVYFLLDELDVTPARPDWREILADADRRLRDWRTWS
jgi:hypothetical protein